MAENIEFIAASNLPEATSDTVDVLCVEDGELKRKAEASLGGGGGYIIVIDPNVDTINTESNEITLTSCSYDDFAPIVYAGGSVWVDFSFVFSGEDVPAGAFYYAPVMCFVYIPGMGVQVITHEAMNSVDYIIACTNGTWTPPTA